MKSFVLCLILAGLSALVGCKNRASVQVSKTATLAGTTSKQWLSHLLPASQLPLSTMKTTRQRTFSLLNRIGMRLLCLGGLFLMLHCKSNGPDADSVPPFLLTGWIWPIDALSVRTYDFTQLQSNGQRTVEIRAWQKIGTLGWQSNQLYSYATYTVSKGQLAITTASGYRENWQIGQNTTTSVTVESLDGRGTITWYNCKEPGWPALILASTRACQ